MSDTTMLDRVAEGLDAQLSMAHDERYELTGPDLALIVFMAMREPTLAICKVGRGALNADACWRIMIEEVLREGLE